MKNKKQKIIIGLVGLSACGKGTVAQYLKKKYNANTHKFSIILRDILNRLYYKIDRTSLQTLSTILRTNFGEDVLAKVIARDVKNDKNKIIVVDGIRRMDDIKYLKKLDHFLLFKIIVKPKIRYKRLVQRNENLGDTKKTYKEFLDDEKKEADLKIPLVMQKAKYAIDNNGSFKELHKQISHNVERITHNVMRSTLCVPRYMIFGPQGSGKGTQAKVLSAKLNIPHISTGSIFREQIKKQTALGKKIKN
ncbi:nucleoside monophosphate kinase, partial [Patescibacteria group bacterium]|nr:nucleoside monophosphate kinase [Patescibacteria group bacterium]MBU1421237.1 nucleoside monophosphate kinase [Patescibacteria group bacterium]MBU2456943.1 nucleoside monophosphate kinase [Patescibacteria group bacterium]MBU2456948.1 nucleoside monophosphate kinase [Patescibacteria group bacterium]